MRSRNKKFIAGAVNHIYQRTIGGVNIFYSLEDRLVYFTIFSIVMSKYQAMVLGLCLMYDHIHILLSVEDCSTLGQCIGECSARFAKEYNNEYSRSGPLFCKRFGSAAKTGNKKVRTAIAYLYNNPVEKKLCRKAEQYRWNFLAYIPCGNPFSSKIRYRESSFALVKAKKEVSSCHSDGLHLNYALLKRLMNPLLSEEREYLTDYIVSMYFPVDRYGLTRYYGNYGQMLTAVNSNTGSEYEIAEPFYKTPDTVYSDIVRYITDKCRIVPAGKVISLPLQRKHELFRELRQNTEAADYQIIKFLHLQTGNA